MLRVENREDEGYYNWICTLKWMGKITDVLLYRGKIWIVSKYVLLCLESDSVTSKQGKYSIGIS